MKKETMEHIRSGRAVYLAILFIALGVMNPAVAKLTPYLLEVMADSLAQSGMTVTAVTVTAMDCWVQFFKNVPMGFIVFLLAESSIFTKEYRAGTLIPALTGGFHRYKVVLGKGSVLAILWTLLYWLSFGITYAYSCFFWNNAVVRNLFFAVFAWWLFGLFCVTLTVFFSAFAESNTAVLLRCGGVVLVSVLLGMFSALKPYVPTSLMEGTPLLYGTKSPQDMLYAVLITVALSLCSLIAAVPLFRWRRI